MRLALCAMLQSTLDSLGIFFTLVTVDRGFDPTMR